MTTRMVTIRRAAIKESQIRVTTARLNLLMDALRQVLRETRRKDGSLFAVQNLVEAVLAGDKRIAALKHPVPDPAEEAKKVIPAYISGNDWLEQNPGAYAPKGR